MTTNETQPGVEVPEPDWSEQLIDTATYTEADGNEVSAPTATVIREADDGDVAEQGIIVEIDDEDGYDESAPI
ncbi:hypothetical protein [Brevibacterium sp. RIT 803]|uniref:hypothetical protein n=1 Tax=Brevibacterium sp. RIT 803 TaxID=2810210 RepID=UPI00194DB395|nr:hypothetical protein [Brevibacterium sp. RIT 803]MBM6588795.1 hypothetical protein [Brevibacterium sp. RIT 803]